MPALLSHTHCQAPQANAKTKACQRVRLSNHTDGKINNEGTTHGIVHAGFRGLRRFVARKKSRCKLIGFRLVIPHDTIPSTVGSNCKDNTVNKKITLKKILNDIHSTKNIKTR